MKLLIPILLLLFSVHMAAAQSCNLYFTSFDSLSNGSIWVTAHLSGPSPAYTWSNGATGATIEISDPGNYSVTATNADGCTLDSTYIAECDTRIRQDNNKLKAYKLLGGTGLTYQWSTGETTQFITPNQSGDYCVTVTGSNDCSGGGQYANSRCAYFYAGIQCFVSILYNSDNSLTAVGTGQAPFTYQWSPGNYTTQTISPNQPGTYCVTITDATGCTNFECQYLYDPADCAVNIFFAPDSSVTSGWLGTEVEGQWWNDWDFQWSTGSTESTIDVATSGSYCVTVTNVQTGCTSSNCFWYWPDSLCWAQLQVDSIGLHDAFLSVTGNPFNIVDYQWGNGGTSAVNRTLDDGWQFVTVTNSQGCTATASIYLNANTTWSVWVQFPDSLNFGNDDVHASIYLIEYDTAQGGILTAIDTVETYTGSTSWALGQFDHVPSGNYLIKAALLPNSNGYDSHLPTYYQEAVLWSQATPAAFHAFGSGWQQLNIIMVPGQNPGGPGFIGGLVVQGANFHGGGDHDFLNPGDPQPGVNVVLTLADGTPVAATVTDDNGAYSFTSLAWGTYLVIIDIPGLPPVSMTVTINQDNPSVSNIDFELDNTGVVPATEAVVEKRLNVYPNPARDVLYIETMENAGISLQDTRGATVLQATGAQAATKLSLEQLPAGVYMLTVRSANTLETVKVIKQ